MYARAQGGETLPYGWKHHNSCMPLLRTVDACSCSRGRVFMRGFRSEGMHHVHHACMIDRSHILSYRWMSRLSRIGMVDSGLHARLCARTTACSARHLHLRCCICMHAWRSTYDGPQHRQQYSTLRPSLTPHRLELRPRACAFLAGAHTHPQHLSMQPHMLVSVGATRSSMRCMQSSSLLQSLH
jgi:hypothetical protein